MISGSKSSTTVTVIGLGAMGTALAATFLNKGVATTVWNRSPEKATSLVARGASHAKQIADAVAASELVVVCLLNYETVYETIDQAGSQLAGRTVVNLTNGTPEQARAMALWMAERNARYLDGGIMAIPPMIGLAEALLLYSGSQEAFETHQPHLNLLGNSKYLGEDAGLAPLYDISLLAGMYGMFAGALQAVALVKTEKVSAVEYMSLLIPWLNAMTGEVQRFAERADSQEYYKNVASNLGMQTAAYVNIIEASKSQGIEASLLMPMHKLMNRGVDAGYGAADLWSILQLMKE
jgi:3-hydroxyisobutyrate dehydrogenase-like beta-hydroxyacid dehydrogenase